MVIHGISAFAGMVVGKASLVPSMPLLDQDQRTNLDLEVAKQKVHEAISKLNIQIEEWKKRASDQKLKTDMLDMQQTILNDSAYWQQIVAYLKEKFSPEAAALRAAQKHAKILEELGDPLLSERAQDMNDIGMRLACQITGLPYPDISMLNSDAILVSDFLSPSSLSAADTTHIKGIILHKGSVTSHTAILASGLGIPTIVGCEGVENIKSNETVFLNATGGFAICDLSEDDKKSYVDKAEVYNKKQKTLMKFTNEKVYTSDGIRISTVCNIMDARMADQALQYGSDGIGLFRTEFLYMGKEHLPSEEEQFACYKSVVQKFNGLPVIIRTMDIGGDKNVKCLKLGSEQNAFLGYRAIRICLDQPDLFRTQLRAILRASAYGNLKIMFPMISDTAEVIKAKEILKQAEQELDKKGVKYNRNIPIGIMIETPAAAILADHFSNLVDFFSIGSNDLTQYTLAVDRTNQKVAPLYHSLSPGVLRLIANTIRCANYAGIECSVCGEMAGDPIAIPILLGLGLKKFSVNPSRLLLLKRLISLVDLETAKKLAEEGLKLSTAKEVEKLIRDHLQPEYRLWI